MSKYDPIEINDLRFETRKATNGEWYWRAEYISNGETACHSETFGKKRAAAHRALVGYLENVNPAKLNVT